LHVADLPLEVVFLTVTGDPAVADFLLFFGAFWTDSTTAEVFADVVQACAAWSADRGDSTFVRPLAEGLRADPELFASSVAFDIPAMHTLLCYGDLMSLAI
jgi:hypothetical protein